MQKKLAILPVMLIVMLFSVGATYAYWYDNLTVVGEITTSDFDVELSLVGWGDLEDKDIVTDDDVTMTMAEDWNSVTITVDGAYPCYQAYFIIGIVCRGKVPAHLKGPVEIEAPPELEIDIVHYPDGGIAFPECWQLHWSFEYFIQINMHVFEDDQGDPPILPQPGATYTFTVTIPLIQYNYNPCFALIR